MFKMYCLNEIMLLLCPELPQDKIVSHPGTRKSATVCSTEM